MGAEIENVTYGLWGQKLDDWQVIQRIIWAGWKDPRLALTMFAIAQGESGFYTLAWHANVKREPEDENDTPPYNGPIIYDAQGRITVRSIDLGFLQRNIEVSPDVVIEATEEAMNVFVSEKFKQNPHLAQADTAAIDAYELYVEREGFGPWYAWKPGTAKFKRKKAQGSKAIGEYLLRTQVGRIDNEGAPATKYPKLELIFP